MPSKFEYRAGEYTYVPIIFLLLYKLLGCSKQSIIFHTNYFLFFDKGL